MKRIPFKRQLIIFATIIAALCIAIPVATFAKGTPPGEQKRVQPAVKAQAVAGQPTPITADCSAPQLLVTLNKGDIFNASATLTSTDPDEESEGETLQILDASTTTPTVLLNLDVNTGSANIKPFTAPVNNDPIQACIVGIDSDETGTVTFTVTSAQISTLFTFKTDQSCDAPVPSQVIFTFTADTQADFSAILNSSDPKEASQGEVLKIFSNFRLETVTSKPGQLVNQTLFNVSAGDKLFACVTKANGDETGIIALSVRNIKFVRLQRLVEFLATAAKCTLGLAGGVLVNATLAISDIVLGHFSAADAILRNLPIPRKACIELAGSVLGFH